MDNIKSVTKITLDDGATVVSSNPIIKTYYGVDDENCHTDPIYDEISKILTGYRLYQNSGSVYKVISFDGKKIIESKNCFLIEEAFDSLQHNLKHLRGYFVYALPDNVTTPVSIDDCLVGLYSLEGQKVLDCSYTNIAFAPGGYIVVEYPTGKMDYLSASRKILEDKYYIDVYDNYIEVQETEENTDLSLYDMEGNLLLGSLYSIFYTQTDKNLLNISKKNVVNGVTYDICSGLYSLKDRKVILDCEWHEIEPLNGFYRVQQKGILGYCLYSLSGDKILDFSYDIQVTNKFIIARKYNYKCGVFSLSGDKILDYIYDGVSFSDNFIFVYKLDKNHPLSNYVGVYSLEGQKILDAVWKGVNMSNGYYFIVSGKSGVGVYSFTGEEIIPAKYAKVEIKDDFAYLTGKWLGFTDKVKLPPTD